MLVIVPIPCSILTRTGRYGPSEQSPKARWHCKGIKMCKYEQPSNWNQSPKACSKDVLVYFFSYNP